MNELPRTSQPPFEADRHGYGDSAEAAKPLDVGALLATFRRRLKLFIALALLTFVAVLVVTIQSTPQYTATSAVVIDTRQENVVESQAVLSGLPVDTGTVDTEVEVLKSRQLAERVVRSLNLQQDPEFNAALSPPGPVQTMLNGIKGLFNASAPDNVRARSAIARSDLEMENTVDAVRSKLGIRRVGLTYVMNVSFTSPDAAKATKIANAYAENYLLEQLEAKFDATRQANTWLNERLSQLRGEVQQNEAAVERYRTANNLLSTSGQTLTEQEISTYNQQLAGVRAQQAEAEARLRTARDQLSRGSSGEDVGEALGSAVVQSLRARRAEVSGRVADMQLRYGPRYPDMLRAQGELRDIDSQIQAEIQRIISNLEAQAQVARERTASMAGSLAGARGTLASNNNAAVRLNELERNAESSRTLYQSLLDRFKETTSSDGLEQSDARVVSRAAVPTSPSTPNVPLNLALGLVLALFAGIAAVVLAEMLDSGLATANDLEEKLGLPSLGSVPLVASVAEGPDRSLKPADFLLAKPISAFAEAVRSLRTAIRFSRVDHEIRCITVTSSLPGEGKTTTAVCLARSAAQSGQRVVIVDCDLRRRSVNSLFNIEPQAGLLEVLNGTASLESVLFLDEPSGAYVLPLVKASFTPKDVFNSQPMDDLLAKLRTMFHLTILDTAPVLAVSDTRTLASKSDAVVFLARWRRTPRKAIENALKLLGQSGAHVSGAVLVQVDMRAQARYGYGDAGYYYRDYKSYYTS